MIADAGGLPLAGGGRLRPGRVLRVSGGLVTEADLHRLEAHGLRTLIDLRGRTENRTILEAWAQRSSVRYVWLPVDVAGGRALVDEISLATDAATATQRLGAMYRQILHRHGDALAGAIAAIADGTPVAFGCAAGKDRTGLVAALLQVLLGADEADAARSYALAPPGVDRLRSMVVEHFAVAEDVLARPGMDVLLGAPEATMRETLEHVRTEHGGAEAYLRAHGLTGDAVARLRADLVEA